MTKGNNLPIGAFCDAKPVEDIHLHEGRNTYTEH